MRWMIAVFALALCSVARAESGSRLPQFDIARNCGAEDAGVSKLDQTMSACKQDETAARDQLSKQWLQFRADARRTCSEESSSGGSQSYVELQTCLQLSKEVSGNAGH